jgi:hypothetical protein
MAGDLVMPKHDLSKSDTGYSCTVCGWQWKREPYNYSGSCSGLPQYSYWNPGFRPPPEHLKTKS